MSKLLILKADDWTRVYLDGKIISDNHSINVNDLIKSLIGKTLSESTTKYMEDWDRINEFEYPEDHFDKFAEEEKEKYFKIN
jgi:hypothetical protein